MACTNNKVNTWPARIIKMFYCYQQSKHSRKINNNLNAEANVTNAEQNENEGTRLGTTQYKGILHARKVEVPVGNENIS